MLTDFLHVSRGGRGTRVVYLDKSPPLLPGKRPFVVPVFLPQAGCPHQCAFCNQGIIAGTRLRRKDLAALSDMVDRFLTFRRPQRGDAQLAFFGGNFLGMTPAQICRLLQWAATYVQRGQIDSLRLSTRPDTVSPDSLALIRETPVRTVELGVQSMDDRVLARSQRGHQASDTKRAVALLRQAGYEIGLQIMTGLPGDTHAATSATIEAIIALAPDFVRIYPTLVLAGSPLADAYTAGRYQPPSLDESIDLVARLWLMLTAAGIRVARMGLQAEPGLADGANVLAGPYHPAFGERVLGHVFQTMAAAALTHAAPARGVRIALRVNPRRRSVMTGPGRRHIAYLRDRFHLADVRVLDDDGQPLNQLEVDNL